MMHQNYIIPHPWSIVEEGFQKENLKSSESIFSIGNGAMGQRANFEEHYSGPSFQGSYIAGVYYPDKTRVGWWKNGYPEYFAKVINAPNWIGIDVQINNESLDLNSCKKIENFRRELNMKEGWLSRSFRATLMNDCIVDVRVKRFLSLKFDQVGVISYEITPINQDITINFVPYLDAGIKNEDSNWDDQFWQVNSIHSDKDQAFINASTLKTNFPVCTFMQSICFLDNHELKLKPIKSKAELRISYKYEIEAKKGQQAKIHKFGGYLVNRDRETQNSAKETEKILENVVNLGFDKLLDYQKQDWKEIWSSSDISIKGDVKAQQGIRFNIFQLNQTYVGNNPNLNIGPKGFTGEKYGGSTYWDTEAYCIPFYLATKDQEVAKNLLNYRFNHLNKAIENAKKLGFKKGAALYPMVTMNGEECHNEWEITFEEIHRNGAIAYAIYNYQRYTGDTSYVREKGLEVLIAISRFWFQRATLSKLKNQYVILGVTGPNEYENNVNNNWYTNFLAQWCLKFTVDEINKVKNSHLVDYKIVQAKTDLSSEEMNEWTEVAARLFLPYSEKYQVFLQQEGFLDKELFTVNELDAKSRPINQNWSWDRILRSPYIKQADVLQGFYFFEDHFSVEELQRHFDFYEPFTVHESSLSPCVHSIQAAKLGRMEQAYTFYLQTSRLDLDDYNNEVNEGLHITSMAGTWMSIVEGFGGMRIKNSRLSFTPQIPKQWAAYSFKINFRGDIISVNVSRNGTKFILEGNKDLEIEVNSKKIKLEPRKIVQV